LPWVFHSPQAFLGGVSAVAFGKGAFTAPN
jgi:hypothetical protein